MLFDDVLGTMFLFRGWKDPSVCPGSGCGYSTLWDPLLPTKLGARSPRRASTKGNGVLHPSACAAVFRPSIFHYDKDLPPCQELQQHPQGHPSDTGAIQAMLVLKCDPVGTWWCCPLCVPQSQGDMGALLTAHGLTVAAEEQEPRSVGTRRRLQVISACCPSQIFV